MFPCRKQFLRDGLPGWFNAFHQLSGRWTEYGTTLPCPRQNMHRPRSQLHARLLLKRIQPTGKQQGVRQLYAKVLAEGGDVRLQGRGRLGFKLIQQVQRRFDLSLTKLTAEDGHVGSGRKHHHLQQPAQLLQQVADALGGILHACNVGLVFTNIALGSSSTRFLAHGQTLGLSLDGWQTLLSLLEGTLKPSLDLRANMQQMPDIPLVAAQMLDLTQGFVDRCSSIAHTAIADQPLLLQIPPHPGPTFSIHLNRRKRRPDLGTVNINHIEVGFSALTAVLFIQGQRTWSTGTLSGQPLAGALSGSLYQVRDTAQAHTHSTQLAKTGLDTAIAGMPFDQQGQHLLLPLATCRGWLWDGSQCVLQGLLSFGFPTIQCLSRNLMSSTQLTDQSILRWRGDHLTDPLNALLGCATMMHVSSLRTVLIFPFSPYLSGTFFATFSSIVTVLRAHFEPCLKQKIPLLCSSKSKQGLKRDT